MARRSPQSPLISLLLIISLAFLFAPTSARPWTPKDPCPATIETTVPGDYDWVREDDDPPPPPSFGTMQSIHSALLVCPNITTLDVRVALRGCSEWPDRWNLPLALDGSDHYAPTNLTTLKLRGFQLGDKPIDEVAPPRDRDFWSKVDWYASGRALSYLYHKIIPESQRYKTNMELWLDAMDFSHVTTFSSSRNDMISTLLPHLPALQNLDLRGPSAMSLFLSVPRNTLHNLIWRNPTVAPYLRIILDHHGASLRSLAFHEDESLSGGRAMPTISELHDIAELAPGLESLTIDLPRNATTGWPLAELRAIAALPKLRNLTVYYELASECRRQLPESYSLPRRDEYCSSGCVGSEQYAMPVVNRTEAEGMWRVLSEERERLGLKTLEDVLFWAGDSSPPWDGPLYFPDWLEGKKAYMRCMPVQNEKGVLCFGSGTDLSGRHDPYTCDDRKKVEEAKEVEAGESVYVEVGYDGVDVQIDAEDDAQLRLLTPEERLRLLKKRAEIEY